MRLASEGKGPIQKKKDIVRSLYGEKIVKTKRSCLSASLKYGTKLLFLI